MDGVAEKGTKPTIPLTRQPQFLFVIFLCALLEWVISAAVTLLITRDPKNSLIFGFSILRVLLVAGILALSGLLLLAGLVALKKQACLDSILLAIRSRHLRMPILIVSFVILVWGWLALFCPSYLFGKYISFFERIQPFSIALGLSLAQSWLLALYAWGRLDFSAGAKAAVHKYFWPTLLFAIIPLGLAVFMAVTRFGLLANIDYSYVPGIPLTSLQLFFILLLAGLWLVFEPGQVHDRPLLKFVKKYRLILLLIFIATFLVWGFTPMLRHFFSLEPAAPTFQPLPNSDARVYDIGAISILRGSGIGYFNNENPFYVIFLAVLHFIAGYSYRVMTWLQLLVLAFIPVILFLLGKKYHGAAFGIFLAVVLILRQRNAMLLSFKVSSLNPKLFMTENMALLGLVLVAYLVFLWMRDRKIWLALLCGGCIGATALFRLNVLVLFPLIACLIVPAFWKMGRNQVARHVSAYTLAFLILLIPWILSSVGPDGKPWLLYKFYLIFEERYESTVPANPGQGNGIPPGLAMAVLPSAANEFSGLLRSSLQGQSAHASAPSLPSQAVRGAASQGDDNPTPHNIILRSLYHLLHNFSTSVMSLPDMFRFDDLDHLTQRIYWADGGGWQGTLPPGQTGLIILNLILLAIGLAYAWVHHRWAGLIPLAIFIAYSLSLSVAMNSGGRYLSPMDWVIFFYYGLAILAIIRFVYRALAGKGPDQAAGPQSTASRPGSDRRNLVLSLIGLIFLASLVPMANFVIPVVIAPVRRQIYSEASQQTVPAQENPGARIIPGQIMYPYVYGDRLSFDVLTPTGVNSYSIPKYSGLQAHLRNGELAYIAVRKDAQGAFTQLESIYQWQGTDALLIWRNQP